MYRRMISLRSVDARWDRKGMWASANPSLRQKKDRPGRKGPAPRRQAIITNLLYWRAAVRRKNERGYAFGRRPGGGWSSKIDNPPNGVEVFDGDIRELAASLRADLEPEGKDIWLMGGGKSIQPWHETGLVDSWELYVIPVTLGAGVPLFPPSSPALIELRLASSKSLKNGIVELKYEPRT
jgi:hypothetical protein